MFGSRCPTHRQDKVRKETCPIGSASHGILISDNKPRSGRLGRERVPAALLAQRAIGAEKIVQTAVGNGAQSCAANGMFEPSSCCRRCHRYLDMGKL